MFLSLAWIKAIQLLQKINLECLKALISLGTSWYDAPWVCVNRPSMGIQVLSSPSPRPGKRLHSKSKKSPGTSLRAGKISRTREREYGGSAAAPPPLCPLTNPTQAILKRVQLFAASQTKQQFVQDRRVIIHVSTSHTRTKDELSLNFC